MYKVKNINVVNRMIYKLSLAEVRRLAICSKGIMINNALDYKIFFKRIIPRPERIKSYIEEECQIPSSDLDRLYSNNLAPERSLEILASMEGLIERLYGDIMDRLENNYGDYLEEYEYREIRSSIDILDSKIKTYMEIIESGLDLGKINNFSITAVYEFLSFLRAIDEKYISHPEKLKAESLDNKIRMICVLNSLIEFSYKNYIK